jgi:hypothetical protein
MSRITSRLPIIPGSFEDRSIEGFRLLAKLKAKRVFKAKKAAAASLASPRHVSKQKRRTR